MKTRDEIVERRNRYAASPKPMVAMEANYLDGESTGWHVHAREQLLFAIEGVMLVESAVGAWVVPPNRALWIEAGVEHNVTMSGDVKMRTVYIDAEKIEPLPQSTCVINVSPLMRELIVAAARIPLDYEESGRNRRVMRLLLDEIEACEVLPLHLPMPSEPRLNALCGALIDHPGETLTAEQWASRLGVSAKTIHRLFLQETGMSFARWRQQARLFSALTQIANGEKIIDVALSCGYASQSAFSAMFRKHFGCTPSDFYR